jgi:hypothetical protein
MPKEPRTHYLVEFASRYAGLRFKTLTAGAALWRAEALTDDAESLLELRNTGESKEVRFGNRSGTYEIIAYYLVGLVTCLEWHARSRLVDLLLFRPNSIEAADVKNIATLAISQMVAEGITVPHLLGAATNVSQLNEYLKVFKRVFGALGIQIDIEKELRKPNSAVINLHGVDAADDCLYNIIEYLFEYRNHLVHEIDLGIIGHHSIRSMWTVESAIHYGKSVVSCIKLIESHVTKSAPVEFPNRLREDGGEEDELEMLSARISDIESKLKERIRRTYYGDDYYIETWNEALSASQNARTKELALLEKADFLQPVRHLDMRRSFQIELLKTRLAFLLLLKSELDTWL